MISGARSGRQIDSACEDSAGDVWFYTADAHLVRYNDGNVESLNLNFSTPPICRMIAAEKSGMLWIADVSGMFSIHPENLTLGRLVWASRSVRKGWISY